MMSGQFVPDPEECRLCGQRHWDRNATAPAGLASGCYPYFNVEDSCDDLAGYSSQLRETLKELLWDYRAGLNERAKSAVGRLKIAGRRYLEWRREFPDGRLHRDLFDDELQRQINEEKTKRADSAQSHAQSGPGRVDISVRAAVQGEDMGDGQGES